MEIKTIFMTFFIITTLVSFAYPSLALEDDDDEPLVHSDREMDAVEAISPASEEYNWNILDNLSPKYLDYFKTICEGKIGRGFRKCKHEAIEEILMKKKSVSKDCCLKIVKLGKQCYMETMKLMFRFYQLKRFASHVAFETNEVWNRCSAEV